MQCQCVTRNNGITTGFTESQCLDTSQLSLIGHFYSVFDWLFHSLRFIFTPFHIHSVFSLCDEDHVEGTNNTVDYDNDYLLNGHRGDHFDFLVLCRLLLFVYPETPEIICGMYSERECIAMFF